MSLTKWGGAACAAVVAAGLGLGMSAASATPAPAKSQTRTRPPRHVLLLSIDGLHQRDLTWFVRQHPTSALARLVHGGTSYSRAQTPVPSDSFPGMVGQVTGGNPRTTGVYYDDTFNHALLPAGTTDCRTAKPGAEVAFTEGADKDPNALDAGQGLANLPSGIMAMTGTPGQLLDPKTLPVDPATCTPVYPHQYLHVNTVFEVAKQAGLHTAWSDKHPAYEILGGPSGAGLDDLFAPEINSAATGYAAGADWTKDNAATQQYDGYKVAAVLNEIDGYDHSRTTQPGVPAIFGMNFQSVSTAQKLPTSNGLAGGYLADGVTPGPLLTKALDFVDSSVGSFEHEIANRGLAKDTTIILSAKHGQSPTKPSALTRVDDGPIISGINDGWKATHPGAGDLVSFATDDDIMQLWLSDRSAAATSFVRDYLKNHPATGNDITGAPRVVSASGLSAVYAGADSARYFGVAASEARHPDVLGIVQHGVVYTGGRSKIAEHGGADPQDRDVPLVVFGPRSGAGHTVSAPVETTQIAPSILRLLGLDPRALQAVRIEHTRVLPGVS
ncbi:alkaline phosphatase family protein [Nostocoides sp. HKS02]|uniref:alkaline phosphatase family protein n=1 Tax=Nostocoides sp. HKS02 TaxID=1813880 RepID=UPI001E332801|nr:alkaline phosphatase family protein [Tetrasphaera sp. HKS02]